MWRLLVAGTVFKHKFVESLLGELNRNLSLLELCGFSSEPLREGKRHNTEPEGTDKAVKSRPRSPAPGIHDFALFISDVARLEEERGLVSDMIDNLRKQLRELLPDSGENLGYDGKAKKSLRARMDLAVKMGLEVGQIKAGKP